MPRKVHGWHVDSSDDALPAPSTTRNLGPRLTTTPFARATRRSRGVAPASQPRHSNNANSCIRRTSPIQQGRTLIISASSSPAMQSDQPVAGPSTLSLAPSSSSAMKEDLQDRTPNFVKHTLGLPGSPSSGPSRASKRRRTGQSPRSATGEEDDDEGGNKEYGMEAWRRDVEWKPHPYSDNEEEVDQLLTSNDDEDDEGQTLDDTINALDNIQGDTWPPSSLPSPKSTPSAPVSSPSLAKLLHSTNIEPQVPSPSASAQAAPVRRLSPPTSVPAYSRPRGTSSPDSGPLSFVPGTPSTIKALPMPQTSPALKTSPASKTSPTPEISPTLKAPLAPRSPPMPEAEPLSEYTCPICFFPPTHATLTPCGHICCGACLFTAVRTTMQRGALSAEGNVPRCPVCRADIPGWDGQGGGVIGLRPRAVLSL